MERTAEAIVAEILSAGYREWPVPRNSVADRFFQRRIEESGAGKLLYSLNLGFYDRQSYIPDAQFRFALQLDVALYHPDHSEALHVCTEVPPDGASIAKAEAFVLKLYHDAGMEPDRDND